MKVIVTGGAGFIGSHLVDELVKKDHYVLVVDNLSTGKKEYVNNKADLVTMDIIDPDLPDIFNKFKPDWVFHLAAQKNLRYSLENPEMDWKINVYGGINVIESARLSGVKKVIFTSSAAVYHPDSELPINERATEQPATPYGLAKLKIDNYLRYLNRVYDLPFVSLRPSNAYGPRLSPGTEAGVMAIFIFNLLNNKPSRIFGSGEQTRDFVYVDDVVGALIKSTKLNANGIFNIATGRETSINYLYDMISKMTNKKIPPIYQAGIKGEVFRNALDSVLAKSKLKWTAKTDLEKGLKETMAWFVKNHKKS